jgi:hypothetical protein
MPNWRKAPPQDYMKYWKVIRYFVKAKYGLNQADLDILLFLYSEKYFSKAMFDEFDELLSWDKKRFNNLRKDGWIAVFRKKEGKSRVVYELSYKGRRMVGMVYKKLNGEELPVDPTGNPMFKANVKYMDKVHRNYIKEMNKTIRQQRHQAPE